MTLTESLAQMLPWPALTPHVTQVAFALHVKPSAAFPMLKWCTSGPCRALLLCFTSVTSQQQDHLRKHLLPHYHACNTSDQPLLPFSSVYGHAA